MKVEINGLGKGTVIKQTNRGALVLVAKMNIQVDLPLDSMVPEIMPLAAASAPAPVAIEPNSPLGVIGRIIGEGGNGTTQTPTTPNGLYVPAEPTTTPVPTPINPPILDPRNYNEDSLKARRTLESLRFGLVPHHHIEQFTIGYEELKEWVHSTLPLKTPRIHKVIGAYGTGKSHIMSAIRHIAKQNGCLVAKVEVDGQAISLSDPGKLINALWSTLHGKDFETDLPLVRLYESLSDKGHSPALFFKMNLPRAENHLASVQSLQRMGFLDQHSDLIESVLNGSDEFTPTEAQSIIKKDSYIATKFSLPVSRSTLERHSSFVEELVTVSAIAKLAGFHGLAITIDEFEVESNATRAKMVILHQVLAELDKYLTGKSARLPQVPMSIYFGTLGDELFSADTELDQMIGRCGGTIFQVRALSKDQRLILAEKMYSLYTEVYKLNKPYPSRIVDEVHKLLENREWDDSSFLRQFIKWYIAFLDMLYGPPENASA
jgi:hypothetical protein